MSEIGYTGAIIAKNDYNNDFYNEYYVITIKNLYDKHQYYNSLSKPLNELYGKYETDKYEIIL